MRQGQGAPAAGPAAEGQGRQRADTQVNPVSVTKAVIRAVTADWKVLGSPWLDSDLALTGRINACWVSRSHRLSSQSSEPVSGASLGKPPTERNRYVPVCACWRTAGIQGRRSPPSIPDGAGRAPGKRETREPLNQKVKRCSEWARPLAMCSGHLAWQAPIRTSHFVPQPARA